MLYLVIATIQDDKNNQLYGYRLFNLTKLTILDVSKENILKGIDNIYGVKYDEYYKGIVSTTHLGLSQLPVIEYHSKRIKAQGGILVTELITDSTGIIGAVAYDTNGARGQLDIKSLFSIAKKNIMINFSEPADLGKRIDIIDMGFEVKSRPLDEYKRGSYRETDNKVRKDETGVYNVETISKVPVYNIGNAITSTFNMTANELIMKATNNLKLLSPYYYVLFSTISKQPCTDDFCHTMCVSESKMYYNVGFVSSLTVGELTFVLIHEVLHIAMMHVARCNKRNPKLWNVATDLYINELILHDFDLVPGVEKLITVSSPKGGTVDIPLCMVSTGLYFGLIGEVCNLSKDLPEAIYKRLESKMPPQNSMGSGGDKSNSDKQHGSDSSSGSGKQSSSDENNQGDSSNGGNQSDNPFDEQGGGSGTEQDTEDIYMDGKKLNGSCIDDMKSEVGQDTEEKAEASKDLAKQKAQDMQTKKRMVEDKSGKDLTKGLNGATLAERIIKFELGTKIDWRKVLKNIVAEKPRKKYTLASPNEAYMNMGVTLASRQRIGKPEKLKNIVICIDVSGSISTEELNKFLGEIANIFSHYDVDGLLMYWNTSVCSFGRFSNLKDMLKVDSGFSGGTDVKCVFDFLAGKTTLNGEKTPIRGKDIKAIIVLTDGEFSKNYGSYAREFGRKTLWIIDGNGAMFDTPFGEVVDYGVEED